MSSEQNLTVTVGFDMKGLNDCFTIWKIVQHEQTIKQTFLLFN